MNNQAAVLYAPHDIRIEERPVPRPGHGEALIEIKAVGVCGSDVYYYEHGRIGSYIVLQPLILGHESAGVIVDVGEGVSKSRIGERVAIEPGIPDGICQQCRTGHYNLCPNVRFFGTPPIDGAFTNYVTVPDSFAYKLPDQMSDEEGALIEPLSVGLWACRKAMLRGADHVLITGAGPIGLLAMKVALALGTTAITMTDVFPQRLEIARKLGATRTVNIAETPLASVGVEADVLIECSGNQKALMDGIRSLGPAGRAVAVVGRRCALDRAPHAGRADEIRRIGPRGRCEWLGPGRGRGWSCCRTGAGAPDGGAGGSAGHPPEGLPHGSRHLPAG